MRYMTEGTTYSCTLLQSFVMLGGDEEWHSFQRKKPETDNCIENRAMLAQKNDESLHCPIHVFIIVIKWV